ncbi:YhgE/Pip domain-containing protein [Microbacterium terrisoli]|uniref:YhgE/Pip domain-containing protein n=1 Tax=Microbacterium terrisoli TaxID=3242192 RepID=UPI0028048A86|nr:YhgE/Pip domain-containing protein [Microbacterium protaetiae]
MTLNIERARSRRPITWLTLIGVLLLPVLIGGILVTALYNPTERLDSMNAAIVNNDKAVTVNDQLVPLGRQLTAGLVKGSDEAPSNLTWTISNTKDAEKGLTDGRYQAVITIPEDFSAAAVSSGQELAGKDHTARQATIKVETAPEGRVMDDAITAQLAQTATSVMGEQLSSTTMQNVFVSFTTLGDQLGKAADGATTWAQGARTAADGAGSLAEGTQQLAGGATKLASGATQLASGADGIAGGVSKLSDGASQWAGGARSAADGLKTWAGGATQLAGSTRQLSTNLAKIAGGLSQAPQIPQQVVDTAHQLAANSDQIKTKVSDTVAQLDALVAQCEADGASAQLCAALQQAADTANAALPQINGVIDQSDAIASGVDGLSQLPQVAAGLSQVSGGMTQVAGGMDGLASGAADAAAGVSTLASGADGLASGASQASGGAAQWASGARTWASGTQTWADGASKGADGAHSLAGGVDKLAGGADTIAAGLHKASDALPSFTDQQAKSLATVVADPVSAKGVGENMFGASAIPLLAMLALWFGGLGSFVALQAVSRRALTSRRASAMLALRNLAPAAVIGAAQGLLVAGIVQIAASYDWGTWSIFAAVCVVAGIAFAAVNQALVAVFRGAGRWIAALIGVLAVATGVVSTVPGVLVAIASVLPTSPALSAGLAALTGSAGVGAGIAGLLIWALISFGATVVVVMRRRTTSVKALVQELPLAA